MMKPINIWLKYVAMIQYHVTTYMSMIFNITVIKNSKKLKYYLATYLKETQYAV